MELSVDEKIQAAIQPLTDRIALLEADNLHLKQELAAFQALNQSKPPQKPDRPTTAKDTLRPSQHVETKGEGRSAHKVGPKKQDQKLEEGDTTKPPAPKNPPSTNKTTSSPNPNKDSDKNNGKVRPVTAVGVKPSPNNGKNPTNDKKPKQEEGEDNDKKSHTSKEKEHKTNVGLKSPGPPKGKGNEKVEKKPVVPTAPTPVPAKKSPVTKAEPKNPPKGGKGVKAKQEEPVKQEKGDTNEAIPDQVKVEMKAEPTKEEIPDEVKVESVEVNNNVQEKPYTPSEEKEGQGEQKEGQGEERAVGGEQKVEQQATS